MSCDRNRQVLQFSDFNKLIDGSLGARVALFRALRGLTQGELGQRCGVSQSTISRLERQPLSATIGLLGRICEELDTSIKDLTEDISVSTPAPAGLSLRQIERLRAHAKGD